MIFTSLKATRRGFTLIELLVVIAIIGILSSVVLASLGTAREKARDAVRISDMKNVQKALELYYDSNQSYPPTEAGNVIPSVLVGEYLPNVPVTPSGTVDYQYLGLLDVSNPDNCTAVPCLDYGMFAQLERFDNVVLTSDADQVTITVVIDGTSVACDGTGATPQPATSADERCYDLKP